MREVWRDGVERVVLPVESEEVGEKEKKDP